ncbi:MAG: hypothetical protein JXA93_18650 [Anaerolineae bacterium]|nr:hypothetical protein [Anaerolineae bacterium]
MRKAIRTTVVTFGILAGLAGIEHGVGEILQGSVAPPAPVFESWPDSPAFEILSGEPAMTLVPDLRLTGILAIVCSVATGAWAVLGAHRKRGGLVMILLALAGLPVGAGFGPPLLGTIVGLTATRMEAPLEGWRRRRRLGALWPWSYAGALASWLLLCPGSMILARLFPAADLSVVPAVTTPFSFGLLILTITAALAHDAGDEAAARQSAGAAARRLVVQDRRA